jgi:lipopolysaccharide assembly outer membrane protein LptD (OstA)
MNTRIAVVVALVAAAATQSGVAQDKPIVEIGRVRSGRVVRASSWIMRATNNVQTEVNGWTLRADNLDVHTDPNKGVMVQIVAEGNVSLQRGAERVTFRRLEIDTQTGRGTFELQQ